MKKISLLMFSITFLSMGFVNILHAQEQPDYVGIYKSSPEDLVAINKVITDFQVAIKTKDSALLSSLMMHDDIFFMTPLPQELIEEIRTKPGREKFMLEHDTGLVGRFIKSITESPDTIEEGFYNLDIKMDGNAALVTFDYDFVRNGKVQNYGFETWNMAKVDGAWKIATVFWTLNFPPGPIEE